MPKNLHTRPGTWGRIALFLALASLCLAQLLSFWLDRTYGYLSLDAIGYTISAPQTNTPLYLYLGIIQTVVIALLLAWLLFWLFCSARRKCFGRKRLLWWLALASFGLAVPGYLWVHHDGNFLLNSLNHSDFIDQHYYQLRPEQVQFTQGRPNLIYLMLESVEQTFNQLPAEQPLLPRLAALAAENLSFAGQYEVTGTSWTIGAQTAHFFGLPLKTGRFANFYNGDQQGFLPGAPSLFEILTGKGYQTALFMGSAANFAGTGQLMDSHAPNAEIHDYAAISATLEDPDLCAGDWGLRDDCLYTYTKRELSRLATLEQPFCALIATIDTHSEHRPLPGQAVLFGDERDNFAGADKLTADFLDWLAEQPFYANTVVVVLGDHQLMSNRLGPHDLRRMQRAPFNALIQSRALAPVQTPRQFSALDWAPTILSALGAQWGDARFGLGVSLFSSEPTLIEQYGFDEVNRQLGRQSALYQDFLR